MSRLVIAVVEIAVVHGDQVHVAEDEAVVLCILQSLRVANIQQLGTIESVLTQLVDDVDAVVDPLTSKDRVEVVEPVLQVVFPVTEWDDDGNLPSRPTVRRRVAASLRHIGVFFLHSFHRHLGAELDQQTPHQARRILRARWQRLRGRRLVGLGLCTRHQLLARGHVAG